MAKNEQVAGCDLKKYLLLGVSPVLIRLARNSRSVKRPPKVEIQSSSCVSCQQTYGNEHSNTCAYFC